MHKLYQNEIKGYSYNFNNPRTTIVDLLLGAFLPDNTQIHTEGDNNKKELFWRST